MGNLEKQAIIDYIRALSLEEKEVAADALPVEICFNRVSDFINKTKRFENELYTAVNKHVKEDIH